MKRLIISVIAAVSLLFSQTTYALFGVGDVVFDPAAVAKLIEQIQQFQQMITTLRNQYEMLRRYAEIDHDGLANIKFGHFLSDFEKQFDEIIQQINSYQDGGLLGQISRLDEVYAPYHTNWDEMDRPGDFTYDADKETKNLKKQLLWTKIQLKHAALAAAKVRENLPKSQEQIETLLDDTNQAQGILLTAQIGNQLMGTVGKSLNTLNVQLTEMVQAQVAEGLEKNQREGHKMNRAREAIEDWGTKKTTDAPAPLNPFGAK